MGKLFLSSGISILALDLTDTSTTTTTA